MKKHTICLLSIIAGIVLLASCNRWEDPEFQVPVYTGPAANHTIQDIKNMHTSLGTGAQDSICSWDEPFIVKAVVVSSDQGGNCYKYMTIQDETGGRAARRDIPGSQSRAGRTKLLKHPRDVQHDGVEQDFRQQPA